MIIRLDTDTITEIKRNSFLTDKEYYKYLMNNALKKSPKFIDNNKPKLNKKLVNNVVNNSDTFIKKFIN